ncbi:General transcription factor IIF subunit 1 [Saguinus oedipus]|uniref:Transcription initiation factor IIF subunit alpha n=1 Tax=Saguinus oedipus TaxID=9490 RepID=A0ABQ9TQW6_SAGOE|nr:General transcription factor IIF subunit 1 [Saguinus oedipus]
MEGCVVVSPGLALCQRRSGVVPGLSPPCLAHRRNKVLNHFSIMQQRRLKDQDQDEDEEEKEKRGRRKASELRIHDLEDDLEMSSDASDASGGRTPKVKKKAPLAKGSRKKKKKKGSDDEAFEDSDDGDFEGQEVDYMSDGSR